VAPDLPAHDSDVAQSSSENDMAAIEKISIAPIAPYASLALLDSNGEVRALEDVEAEVIRFAIAHYRGQMSEVARRLRIGRSTLYRKLDVLGDNEEETENRVVIE
jgi:DNA-binding NtrC family response regulator